MNLKFKIDELNVQFKATSPQVILKKCIENLYKKKNCLCLFFWIRVCSYFTYDFRDR